MKSRSTKKVVLVVVFLVLLAMAALISQGVTQASLPGDVVTQNRCGCTEGCQIADPAASCDPLGYSQRAGDKDGENLGISVGSAGYVNDDCYADIIIGASGYDNPDPTTTNEGRVLVYYGSPNGIDLTQGPDWTAEGNSNNSQFGFSCGTAGDLNHDGCDDIVVGAYKHKTAEGVRLGRVAVYYSRYSQLPDPPVPDWQILGEHKGCGIGYSVAAAGKVDGDVYDDLVVGAPTFSNGQPSEGKVYVFFGENEYWDSEVECWTYESNADNACFGWSVAVADVNGDQKNDIIVGAYRYGPYENGKVYVFHGGENFRSKTAPDWEKTGLNHTQFGYSVARAGDVNGDGYDDVIIGAPNAKINNLLNVGMAYVYYGSNNGLQTCENSPWVVQGVEENEKLGYVVGCAGKINYDGAVQYDDIFVGVPGYMPYNHGGVFLFHGSSSGVVGSYSSHACTITGPRTYSSFGKSGSMAGDVNNDGCDDLIIGAPYLDGGYTECGFIRLLYGYKSDGCPYLLPPSGE